MSKGDTVAAPTVGQQYKFLMAKQETFIASLVDALDALGGRRVAVRDYTPALPGVTIPESTRPTFSDLTKIDERAQRVGAAAEQFRAAAACIVDQVLSDAEATQ